MAAHEGLHALHERLLRAGRHEQHAHATRWALRRAGAPARPARRRRWRCRWRPGTTRVEPICANTAAAPAETIAARAAQRSGCPSARRARPAPGPANTGHISGGLVSLSSISAGKRRQANAGMRGMEDQPGLRGVVVGDQHDGAARVRRAHLRHDVEGVAPRQQRGARGARPPVMSSHTPAAASADSAAPASRCRRADQRARRAGRAQQRQRPPVVAVRPLGLDRAPGRRARAGARRPTPPPGARPPTPRAGGSRPARSAAARRRSTGGAGICSETGAVIA